MKQSPFCNELGELSGAKGVLILACVLAAAFVIRELVTGAELTEATVGLIGILLFVGLINRMSARGSFRVRVNQMEVESLPSHRGGGHGSGYEPYPNGPYQNDDIGDR